MLLKAPRYQVILNRGVFSFQSNYEQKYSYIYIYISIPGIDNTEIICYNEITIFVDLKKET